jgi:transposase-like protein
MTRPFSLAFKQKMIERLTGKDALSATQLSRQTGVRQQNLSRWLEEARSLPVVAADAVPRRKWTVEQKARMLAEAANLSGEALCTYLEGEGVSLVDFERWRVALEEVAEGHRPARGRDAHRPHRAGPRAGCYPRGIMVPMTRTQALRASSERAAKRLENLYTGLSPNELLDRQNQARRMPTAESRAFVQRIVDGLRRGR